MKIENIEKKIIKILEKKGTLVKKDKDKNDYNFIENGHIDSVSFVKFISEIETKFKISIPNKLFYSKKISTIKGLEKIIKRLLKWKKKKFYI